MNCSRPDPAFVRQARNADGVGCRKWNVTTHPLHERQAEGLNGLNNHRLKPVGLSNGLKVRIRDG